MNSSSNKYQFLWIITLFVLQELYLPKKVFSTKFIYLLDKKDTYKLFIMRDIKESDEIKRE